MGHMLNNTIQDVLIRRARLKGFNACWVPGTDHASIATEAKVVAKLKEEGIKSLKVSVETHQGVVLLSGFVETEAQIQMAGKIAAETEGVKSVKNSLILKKD